MERVCQSLVYYTLYRASRPIIVKQPSQLALPACRPNKFTRGSTDRPPNPPMQRHAAIVADISAKVRQFYDKKIPFRISHGSTNSTRHSLIKRQNVVDTSQLCRVLSIDRERRTALVEPNVPMDKLVAATLPHGLIPPVVMEFPGITAGGGYAGTAGRAVHSNMGTSIGLSIMSKSYWAMVRLCVPVSKSDLICSMERQELLAPWG